MKNAIRRIRMMNYNAGKKISSIDPIIAYKAKIERKIYARVLTVLTQEQDKEAQVEAGAGAQTAPAVQTVQTVQTVQPVAGVPAT